jgi:hypothetical protein
VIVNEQENMLLKALFETFAKWTRKGWWKIL